MENRSLVTIAEHSREKILYMLEMAKEFEAHPNRHILDGKVVATLFFEPSTRTRLSFKTAANRLGARVIGFSDPKATSSSKGETLKDTIKMVSNYADIIVMRHHLEGAARYASEVTTVPIVNAGDGANQHPSQTMLDLYSIYKTQGTLENLNIFLVGDLKYGRTRPLPADGYVPFQPHFPFIAPDELRMPVEYKLFSARQHHIPYFEHTEFTEEIIADADILYMTRVQRERFTDLMEYERVKNVYRCATICWSIPDPTCESCIRSPVLTKYLMMWTTIPKHIISSRHKTDCMPVKLFCAMYWASRWMR